MMVWQNADYWAMLWHEERSKSLYGLQKQEKAGAAWWDQRAEFFAKKTLEENEHNRQARIMSTLERNGFLKANIEMLDIGSGPGNFALLVAPHVKRVVALDPSSKMLKIMEKRAANKGVKNIEAVNLTWEEVDIDKLGWRKRFGLVFAALTPGIHDVETLQKMIDASSNGCFYSSFCRCEDYALKDLWRILYAEEMPPIPADIFYIFHLLYAWGYVPILELHKQHTEKMVSMDEAEQQLALLMEPYPKVKGLQEQIRSYLQQKSNNGVFNRVRDYVEGNLIWTVP
jgi:SAM-dependent methyltransferase